jgi:cell division protein FtsB
MRRRRPTSRFRRTAPSLRLTRSRRTRTNSRFSGSSRPEHPGRRSRSAAPPPPSPLEERRVRRESRLSKAALRRTALTKRAAVLGIVCCMLVLTLAYPLRSYLSQRAQIRDVAAQNAQDRDQVAQLQQAVNRYHDPKYIEQLARIRLHYAYPGDKMYYLIPAQPTAPVIHREGHAKVQVTPEKAWYDQLWGSAVSSGK